ncbi:caspase family protein [Sediminitomix flava]|uniref:PEGA domain-containing protein n=1 Tax=Sediminitomix flava TaxID=379075 RepID=A0A315Z9C5_SEDFL|nr:caspase family protein [Sediminitomix flava]PWJ42010.1 PEGA domain-containing protein [Sediminitomix flava]
MKLFAQLALLLTLSVCVSSCATVFKGRYATKRITISSDPAPAKVYIDGIYVGETPLKARVSQREEHELLFKREGYYPVKYFLKRKPQLSYLLFNLVTYGVGIPLDFATGAIYTPDHKYIRVAMLEKKKEDEIDIPEKQKNLVATIETENLSTSSPVVEMKNIPLSDVDLNIPKVGKLNQDAIAVVIGNKDYKNTDIPSVDFALKDAQTVKKYLTNTLGFSEGNIIYLENATQAQFNAVFGSKEDHQGKLFNYIKPNKSDVFVFYSGHGAPDIETKSGYFIPVDCDPTLVKFGGYSQDVMFDNLSKLPYRNLTVVLDACFSGVSSAGPLVVEASPVFIRSGNKIFHDENAMVFTSSSNTQVSSWYPEKGHSMFTYYFLKGIQGEADSNQDRQVSLSELENYIQEEVSYRARRLYNRWQTPQVTGDFEKIFSSY